MIGSWLGNKLFNNQNFQNQKAAQYKSPQTYSKSQSSFNKPSSTAGATKQSGFLVVIIKIQAKTIIVQNLQLKVQEVDMKLEKIEALTPEYLESIGFTWHTDSDDSSYICDKLVVISEDEANAYYEATNELYDMVTETAQFVIDNELFHELNIPFNLVELVKESWENDVHWHLYSRFDLAGGVNGKPIKLIEFNADTPTSVLKLQLSSGQC